METSDEAAVGQVDAASAFHSERLRLYEDITEVSFQM